MCLKRMSRQCPRQGQGGSRRSTAHLEGPTPGQVGIAYELLGWLEEELLERRSRQDLDSLRQSSVLGRPLEACRPSLERRRVGSRRGSPNLALVDVGRRRWCTRVGRLRETSDLDLEPVYEAVAVVAGDALLIGGRGSLVVSCGNGVMEGGWRVGRPYGRFVRVCSRRGHSEVGV